jgi:hypothetical protein
MALSFGFHLVFIGWLGRGRHDVGADVSGELRQVDLVTLAGLRAAPRRGASSPTALRHLLDVARQNVAVDAGFDLTGFVQHASGFTDRAVSLYTLPITEFGQDAAGEDVNLIDVPTIRAIVDDLTTGASPTTGVLNVINATTHSGLATSLMETFASRGFSPGQATTADTMADTSSLDYGPGASDAAQTLADQFGLTAPESQAVGPSTVQLTLGADFPAGDYLTNTHTAGATALAATRPEPPRSRRCPPPPPAAPHQCPPTSVA